jgi:hypothetical protein
MIAAAEAAFAASGTQVLGISILSITHSQHISNTLADVSEP